MERNQLYLSTIAADAGDTARHFGIGLEIAEFATAWFMDDEFPETDAILRKTTESVNASVLHAPFNELFPCAIDRKARALAADRYRQAIALADSGKLGVRAMNNVCPLAQIDLVITDSDAQKPQVKALEKVWQTRRLSYRFTRETALSAPKST